MNEDIFCHHCGMEKQHCVCGQVDYSQPLAPLDITAGDDYEDEHYNPFKYEMDKLVKQAKRGHEYWDLGGCDGPSPYADLYSALQVAIDEVEFLMKHQCEYDHETDYCIWCGRDGRA